MNEEKLVMSEDDVTPETIAAKMSSIKDSAQTEQETLDNKRKDEVEYGDEGPESEIGEPATVPVEN